MSEWKRRGIFLLAAIGFGLHGFHLSAAGVSFPLAPAAWTVSLKPIDPKVPAKSNTSMSTVVSISTVVTNAGRIDTFAWSNARTTSNWRIDRYLLFEVPYNNSIYISANGQAMLPYGEIYIDKALFNWTQQISAPSTGTYLGKEVLVFTAHVVGGNTTVPDIVYADPITLLPLALIRNNTAYEFTFNAASPTLPRFPARFADRLAAIVKANTPPVILNHNR